MSNIIIRLLNTLGVEGQTDDYLCIIAKFYNEVAQSYYIEILRPFFAEEATRRNLQLGILPPPPSLLTSVLSGTSYAVSSIYSLFYISAETSSASTSDLSDSNSSAADTTKFLLTPEQ